MLVDWLTDKHPHKQISTSKWSVAIYLKRQYQIYVYKLEIKYMRNIAEMQ